MAMIFKDIDTVLFDFDGTLADTERLILDSWQETFMEMKGERAEEDFLRGTFGEPLLFSMENLFPEDPQRAVNIYRAYNEKHFLRDVELFPGMLESLRAIRAAGFQTGLVTARLRKTTFMGLEKFDMVKDFDAIVTEEDCSKSKPDPAPMYTALGQLAEKRTTKESKAANESETSNESGKPNESEVAKASGMVNESEVAKASGMVNESEVAKASGMVQESGTPKESEMDKEKGVAVAGETIKKMARRTIYIGDTIHDLGCANNAGVKCVLVGWSPTVKRSQYVLPGESNPDGKPVVDAILQKGADLPALLGLSR